MTLHHTFTCPLEGFPIRLTVDLGMTETQYADGLQAGEYRALVDVPDWDAAWGDKPVFPLTRETISALPFIGVRYISSSVYIRDALDDYMEVCHPLSKTSS